MPTAGNAINVSTIGTVYFNGTAFVTTGSGGELWSTITSSTQQLVVSNGYVANYTSGRLAFTLPATASVGQGFEIVGLNGSGGWSIAQASGQYIRLGNTVSTTGTGGSVDSSSSTDSVRVICVVANSGWQIVDAVSGPSGLTFN